MSGAEPVMWEKQNWSAPAALLRYIIHPLCVSSFFPVALSSSYLGAACLFSSRFSHLIASRMNGRREGRETNNSFLNIYRVGFGVFLGDGIARCLVADKGSLLKHSIKR